MSDRIVSRPASEAYRANFDAAFRPERTKHMEDLAELLHHGVAMPPELERRMTSPDAARIQAARANWPWAETDRFWKEYVPNRIAELAAEGKPGWVFAARDFMPALDQPSGGYVDNVDCTVPDSDGGETD